ncbi:MAG: GGDEF domain-containing protein [Pontiellaceae bacterium]|nr:GGDEF domain-containing protein [Pontiellaceae bacterium]MBN2785067.1 GGDEF domain-containing protein [Pontiellaceae bacterium]
MPFWITLLALADQATRDPLTGLYNRRYFDETLTDHIEAAKRYNRELSLILLDLDHFKRINDALGHEAGDAALRQFADKLKVTARAADIVCRIGGDEFAVILPETGEKQARIFFERLHATSNTVNALPSATAGIAALPCENLFATADAALMNQKQRR